MMPAEPQSLLECGVIPFAFPGVPGVYCGFSTALAGNMSIEASVGPAEQALAAARRASLMQRCGFSRWGEVYQVHGEAIVENFGLEETDIVPEIRADGHYTLIPGVGLVIKTADCQPLLLARADGRAIAALHVGWRGNILDLPAKGVARFCKEFSCTPKDLHVVRGPSLGPGAAEFINFAVEWPERFQPWFNPQTKTMNLWELTRYQLESSGIPGRQIYSLDLCTHTEAATFFSYRRKQAGRQANIIWRV